MSRLDLLFSKRNRGLLLDVFVFVFQLLLLRLLTKLSIGFFQQAEHDAFPKLVIAFFLLGLFLLQSLGPMLKRWSFHQRFPDFERNMGGLTSLLLSFYRFFYIGAMAIMLFLAYVYFAEAIKLEYSDAIEKAIVAAALVLPIASAVAVFRFFHKPSDRFGKFTLLESPLAETLGDLCMLLNIIGFQILFSVYVSSPHFWNALHKTTRLASNNLDSLSARLYIAFIASLLAYFPPRIFYLVVDQHRLITWLTMLLANLPLIYAIVFYVPAPQQPRLLHQPSFTVTAAELHDEYEQDNHTGIKKYSGNYINVTGRVQTRFFPRSLELKDQIGLDGKDGYPWVYCSFDEDQVESAEALELGQQVTFQCVGSSDWSHGAALEHCVVIR
ncbi:MAG: hypothetical protein C5B55_05645 [Blastocatellia bacterium]|nr:MAG: hypothetical protein C5B55_05645 [Blastocatellia bacterium]